VTDRMADLDHIDPHHRWHLTWLGSDRLLARGLARPVARFLTIEAAGGILLLVGALVAVVWANSPWSISYVHLWETPVGVQVGGFSLEMDLRAWVNDAAMALFFFVAGMEIKREMVSGELKDPKAAALPIIGAAGGMLVPALIYLGFNHGGPGGGGWGIPMATDIAFAVGIVSLLGPRVPVQLKLFLLTLAVADDLGAIFVIAIAYSQGLQFAWLLGAFAMFGLVVVLRRAHIWYLPIYVVCGVIAWYLMLRSGVHATVAGVVLGFLTPTKPLRQELQAEQIAARLDDQPELSAADVNHAAFHIKEAVPLDERLIDVLHPWTSYIIIPIFALANAGIPLSREALQAAVTSTVTIGVFLGLVVGKTVGVFGASVLAAKIGVARLPRGVTLLQMLGIAMGAGIGFTVAIFVTGISLHDPFLQDQAKIGIFAASLAAALLSVVTLTVAARRRSAEERALELEETALVFEHEPVAHVVPP
jgi:NhaA family Na+:H+ antiporter